MIGRIGLIELGIGLIERGKGLIELRTGLIELGIGLIELGIGLIELGLGLRINNARRTVCARASGLVSECLNIEHVWFFFAIENYLCKKAEIWF